MRQRLAAGLLRHIGLQDTIAASLQDYVNIAVRLAEECADPDRRDICRRAIMSAVPRMNNDTGVVRAFETVMIDAHAGKLAEGVGQSAAVR